MLISNYCGQISGLAEVQPGEHHKKSVLSKRFGKKIPLDDEMFMGTNRKPWEMEISDFSEYMLVQIWHHPERVHQ